MQASRAWRDTEQALRARTDSYGQYYNATMLQYYNTKTPYTSHSQIG